MHITTKTTKGTSRQVSSGTVWTQSYEMIRATFDDIIDEQGRAVGGTATITTVTSVTDYAAQKVVPCDLHYVVRVRATRDGSSYGALHGSKSFATLDEARTHVAAQFAAQYRRYAKKFGRM